MLRESVAVLAFRHPVDRSIAVLPVAATMVLRSMIDFPLLDGRASRYRNAARHLLERVVRDQSIARARY